MTTQESILRIQLDSRQAHRNGQLINNELQAITKNGNSASKSMDVMSVATRNLAASMAGLVTVGTAISKMDAYTSMQNRLKLVTNSQEELNKAMADTLAIANKTGSAWDSVIQVYQRFSDNAKTLGIDMQKTAELTETVSKAVAVSGASTQAAEAALTQFGQALASGVLRGEELNSVMEQTPALAKAIAQGMGITIGELRSVAAEGKITSEVLVESLTKASTSVDELFAKTDFTIGQSITVLNNEVTKFVGEAGKASGAASFLADSIKVLAQNLSLIANVAVLGGVALLTKAIITQTLAVKTSITTTMAARAATAAQVQADIAAAAAKTKNAQAAVAQAKAELASAGAKAKSTLATKAETVELMANARAKYQNAAATLAQAKASEAIIQSTQKATGAATLGSRAFALLGGPIGAVTIGVTALAAGYMYMSSRAAEANKKLEEQGQNANKTKDELLALQGAEKAKASSDLKEAFAAENEELERRGNLVEATIAKISSMNTADAETARILRDVRTGAMSYTEAYKKLNETQSATPDIISKLREQIDAYDESSIKSTAMQKALKVLGFEVKTVGNEAQNAANKVAENTTELDKNTTAAEKAAKAQKGYFDSLKTDVLSANERLAYMNQGFSKEVIDQINELQKAKQKALGEGVTVIITTEEINKIVQAQNALDAVKDKEDEILAAKREQNKEANKSLKVLQLSAKVQANAAKYNFSALESQYKLPQGTLSTIHAIETGNTGKTNQVNASTGATGGFQFLSGTAKQYGVKDRTNLAQSAEGAAKYMNYLLKLFKGDLEKAVKAYHAGEGNVQRGTNLGKYNRDYWNKFQGYMGSGVSETSGDLKEQIREQEQALKEQMRLLEQQAEARKKIEFDTLGKIEQERERLKDKFIEIDEAAFSPEQAQKMREFYQKQTAENIARIQNEEKLEKQALADKINGFSDYLKSEEELLKDSYDKRKFLIETDLDLNKDQREAITKHLDAQLQKEIALISLAKEERLFQLNQQFMTETEMINARYALETKKLIEISDLKERQAQDEANRRKRDEAIYGVMSQAQAKWNDVRPNQNANNPYIQNEENRRNQLNASGEVYRAGMADIANREQDPNADFAALNAEKEALLQTHTQNMLDIQKAYEQARMDLNLSYGEQITGSMASIFKDMAGEQSSAYKAMFAIEKGFTIAQAALAMQRSIAAATAIAFPANLPAIAAAVAQGAQIASAISSIKATGFYSGGYTGSGNPRDEAGVVHKEEYVMTAKATKRIGVDTLNALNYGGGSVGGGSNISVSIENYGTSKSFEVQQLNENQVRIIARDEAVKAVSRDLANPNSLTSKALKQSKNVTERR